LATSQDGRDASWVFSLQNGFSGLPRERDTEKDIHRTGFDDDRLPPAIAQCLDVNLSAKVFFRPLDFNFQVFLD